MKIVVIGGGAGGASFAARMRRLDNKAEIIILEKTDETSIASCGLPYYIGNIIEDRSNMQVASPAFLKQLFDINVELNAEVDLINPQEKFVQTTDGRHFAYDKLVLATGTKPFIPPLEGLDKMPHFTVKSLADADKIKAYIAQNKPQRATVVGGGFIGVEVAENLCHLGLKTALVEMADQVLLPLDTDLAVQVHKEMVKNGMELYLKDGLKLLSRPFEVVDAPNARRLKVKAGQIDFKDVNYHYKHSDALFKGFNLHINAGEKIGLVGRSGSGKSTLIKLLSRYYDIQGGSICIDEQNIAEVTQKSLRAAIALIPQDPSLFNRTIMENIRYGKLRASDEEVYAAAKKAYIHDFIMSLPEGYKSKVGERGVMLSGGERQRIAIARAILKDAPILILDEATSALDSESEKYIQASIRELMKNKTVIAIAHRLSTLKEMDKIIVMDKGKIIESGTHTELLRKKGLYHGFYDMQSQGFINMNSAPKEEKC